MTKDSEIEQQYRKKMNALGMTIDELFNGPDANPGMRGVPDKRKTGFLLMVFPFEGFDGRANYISNARRQDIVVLLKEMAARFEGQPEIKGHA